MFRTTSRGGYGREFTEPCFSLTRTLTIHQGIIATMVQMFYARRILVLTKNKWITAVVVISSAVSGRMHRFTLVCDQV